MHVAVKSEVSDDNCNLIIIVEVKNPLSEMNI
jgi:hypothetical protein